MNLYQEQHFEREVCERMAAHGWLQATQPDNIEESPWPRPRKLVAAGFRL